MTLRRAALFTLILAACRGGPGAALKAGRPSGSASEWQGERGASRTRERRQPWASNPGWVLHIGDSFVDASFQQSLRPLFRDARTPYVSSGITATYTTSWANDPELDRWLARRPALVIVTLGANEVDMPFPEEHAKAVGAIARKIASAHASCVWTTPPMWKAETGILEVIFDHCSPCLFFDSDAILGGLSAAERKGDGIHPNTRGGARWAQALWAWLEDHQNPDSATWALLPYERRDP